MWEQVRKLPDEDRDYMRQDKINRLPLADRRAEVIVQDVPFRVNYALLASLLAC